MSELVADCPRCGAKEITFDLISENFLFINYNWQNWYEVFCICRRCKRATIFVLRQNNLQDEKYVKGGLLNLREAVNNFMRIEGYVSLKDFITTHPPEYIPANIEFVFKEGASCLSIGCFNAAGTMFRLCIDLATKNMLPVEDIEGLNYKTKRELGLRLPWLFDNSILPGSLRELSSCVKDDGNDGAHEGTLNKEEAEDLLDFTYAILERIYTEPKRVQIAKERREARRENNQK